MIERTMQRHTPLKLFQAFTAGEELFVLGYSTDNVLTWKIGTEQVFKGTNTTDFDLLANRPVFVKGKEAFLTTSTGVMAIFNTETRRMTYSS